MGPHRDVTGEVSAAVKAAGLHSGLYHSLFEWYNPLYLADKAAQFNTTAFVPKTMGELVDLVKRYEPDVIWSDGGCGRRSPACGTPRGTYRHRRLRARVWHSPSLGPPLTPRTPPPTTPPTPPHSTPTPPPPTTPPPPFAGDWEAPDAYWDAPANFLAWLVNDSPVKDTVVYNDRWGIGDTCHHGSFYTCSDRYSPGKLQNHKWENAMTLDGDSWGYRRNAALGDYLTFAQLVGQLASTVSCGGNLLVNVGPALDGTIPLVMQGLLRQLGAWLRVNGPAVYDTTPWRQQNETAAGVWYTAAGPTLYALVLRWPRGGAPLRLALPVAGTNMSAALLTASGGVACAVTGAAGAAGVTVTLPPYEPDLAGTGTDTAWALRIEGVT